MGYGVGFRDGRWIGYSVPAECDWPDCHEMIDHGMAYLCEYHYSWEENADDEDIELEDEGCGLYFCSEHINRTDEHEPIQPKPDNPRWLWWILNDGSWAKWREENPGLVKSYEEAVKDFDPDAELLEELEMNRTE